MVFNVQSLFALRCYNIYIICNNPDWLRYIVYNIYLDICIYIYIYIYIYINTIQYIYVYTRLITNMYVCIYIYIYIYTHIYISYKAFLQTYHLLRCTYMCYNVLNIDRPYFVFFIFRSPI